MAALGELALAPNPYINAARGAPALRDELAALKDELISQVVKTLITEAAISVAMVTLTCFFVASTSVILTFALWTIAVLGFKALFHVSSAYIQYRQEVIRNDFTPEALDEKENNEMFQRMAAYFNSLSFALIYGSSLGTLIHEKGHAIAANLVFKLPNPQITITGPFEGVTRWSWSTLTSFGEKFGLKNARLFVAAGGTVLALLTSLGLLILAYGLKGQQPEISQQLNMMAFVSISSHAEYALSALFSSSPGHDFATLAAGGIHPLFSFALIILIPLLLLGLLHLIDRAFVQAPVPVLP